MIDRSDAVNLARQMEDARAVGRGLKRSITDYGIHCLADAVLAMDEYIRKMEQEQSEGKDKA